MNTGAQHLYLAQVGLIILAIYMVQSAPFQSLQNNYKNQHFSFEFRPLSKRAVPLVNDAAHRHRVRRDADKTAVKLSVYAVESVDRYEQTLQNITELGQQGLAQNDVRTETVIVPADALINNNFVRSGSLITASVLTRKLVEAKDERFRKIKSKLQELGRVNIGDKVDRAVLQQVIEDARLLDIEVLNGEESVGTGKAVVTIFSNRDSLPYEHNGRGYSFAFTIDALVQPVGDNDLKSAGALTVKLSLDGNQVAQVEVKQRG